VKLTVEGGCLRSEIPSLETNNSHFTVTIV